MKTNSPYPLEYLVLSLLANYHRQGHLVHWANRNHKVQLKGHQLISPKLFTKLLRQLKKDGLADKQVLRNPQGGQVTGYFPTLKGYQLLKEVGL